MTTAAWWLYSVPATLAMLRAVGQPQGGKGRRQVQVHRRRGDVVVGSAGATEPSAGADGSSDRDGPVLNGMLTTIARWPSSRWLVAETAYQVCPFSLGFNDDIE